MKRFCVVCVAAMLAAGIGVFRAQTPAASSPQWDVVAVAHRGLSAGYPENTLAAFKSAIALGVQAIELDLRGTADGEVVVLHDATVDRTTNGRGDVTGLTLREVKALDAGSHAGAAFSAERVPTYEEVLQLVKGSGVTLLLDIKISPVLDKARVVRLTERHGATLNVIVGVRSVADLNEFRTLNPDIVRLWPEWIHADPALVGRLHGLGKPVWTTAGTLPRQELESLIRRGVNGILTDVPEVLTRLLAERR
jgi:glycerophosphoryl diester phosphodiesterase